MYVEVVVEAINSNVRRGGGRVLSIVMYVEVVVEVLHSNVHRWMCIVRYSFFILHLKNVLELKAGLPWFLSRGRQERRWPL